MLIDLQSCIHITWTPEEHAFTCLIYLWFFCLSDRNTHNNDKGHWGVAAIWKKDWDEKNLHLWEGSWEVSQVSRAVTHCSVILHQHLSFLFRLLAANPNLSNESAHILLERGLAQVEDGTSTSPMLRGIISLPSALLLADECFSSSAGFVFSRDLRVNFVSHLPNSHICHALLCFYATKV